MNIQFLTLEDITTETQIQINHLFKELTDIKPTSVENLRQNNAPIFIATYYESEILVGMATMVTYNVISGKKAWIEDVVVSEKFRGKGIGKKLIEALINKSKELKISTILLFSNPKREVAHRLYLRMGFSKKESTLFMMNL